MSYCRGTGQNKARIILHSLSVTQNFLLPLKILLHMATLLIRCVREVGVVRERVSQPPQAPPSCCVLEHNCLYVFQHRTLNGLGSGQMKPSLVFMCLPKGIDS